MKKQNRIICAGALAITVFAVSLAGCAGGSTSSAAAESGAGASSSGGTTYVGKVTAITGNQVELALGTVEGGQGGPGGEPNTSGGGSQPSGSRPEQTAPTGSGDASGAMQPPAQSGDASGAAQPSAGAENGKREVSITLTGETKTVLIPVGLTLSGSGMGGGAPGGNGGNGGNGGGNGGAMPAQGGGAPTQGNQASSGSAQKTNSQSAQQSSSGKDYSSITVGMILQITETTGTDGTQTISAVRVLSES